MLLVISSEDLASVNMQKRLLEFDGWEELVNITFEEKQVHKYKDQAVMVNIKQYHLFYDHVDIAVSKALTEQGLEFKPDVVCFPTKHRSESGMKTLTVHPIGNYSTQAEYGGKPEELVPSAPMHMTMAHRLQVKHALKEYFGEPEYRITLEVTHHGPYLETPSFFIEIGSDEQSWVDERAAKVNANSMIDLLEMDLESECGQYPIAIGIGGGHYAPRHTDVLEKKQITFGHMVPNYAIDNISDAMLLKAFDRTPGASCVYFHRKSFKKDKYRKFVAWFEDQGLKTVRAGDLADL